MKIEDVRKTVSNPKPLYFAAGLGDAAVEVLKDAPARLGDFPARAGGVATATAAKVAGAAESVQSKIALGQIDPKGLLDPKALRGKLAEPDLRAAREKAQTLLLQQVGRALEVAGKAVETYDEYSERGKVVVDRVLAGRNGADVEVVVVAEVVETESARTVVVEEAEVVAEPAPQAETPKADAPTAAAPTTDAKAEAPKADAKKAAPRRSATPRKKPQA